MWHTLLFERHSITYLAAVVFIVCGILGCRAYRLASVRFTPVSLQQGAAGPINTIAVARRAVERLPVARAESLV